MMNKKTKKLDVVEVINSMTENTSLKVNILSLRKVILEDQKKIKLLNNKKK